MTLQFTAEQLTAHGVANDAVEFLTKETGSVRFNDLVMRNAPLAFELLDSEHMDKVFAELYRSGLPVDAPKTASTVVGLVWALAQEECPTGSWYDTHLHAAVASAHLLRLCQDAFGYDEAEVKRREAEAFADKLGVKPLCSVQ